MREYMLLAHWWSQYPGVRALIVMYPAGGSKIVRRYHSECLTMSGRVALLGVIE